MRLIDTTVAIDCLRGYEPALAVVETALDDDGWLGASELVRFEVLSGARDEELERIEAFFDVLGWVPVDETVTRLGGLLARRFRHRYGGIGVSDYLIAATALALDAELLTTNVRHFPMIEGLEAAY